MPPTRQKQNRPMEQQKSELGTGARAGGGASMPVVRVEIDPLLGGGLDVADLPVLHRLEMPVNKPDVDAAVVDDEPSAQRGALRLETGVSHRGRVLIDQQNLLGRAAHTGDFHALGDSGG